jgi:hypothetical protein
MKLRYIHSTILFLAIIGFLIFCGTANAQPGYYSRMPMPPSRVIVTNPPVQSNRQVYDPYFQNDAPRPFVNFSLHFDPLISWFSTDSYDTRSDGVVPGFNFGVSYTSHFGPNYSFSSGIDIISAGGILTNNGTSQFDLKDYNSSILTVGAGEPITYKVTYLSVPLGLKLETSQLGYGRFFTDVGFAPKIVIGGRADIPSVDIKGGNAMAELNLFNLSFHIMAGMEYPLSPNNSFIIGIGFEKYMFDITKDNGDQPSNVVTQKMLSLMLGMTF